MKPIKAWTAKTQRTQRKAKAISHGSNLINSDKGGSTFLWLTSWFYKYLNSKSDFYPILSEVYPRETFLNFQGYHRYKNSFRKRPKIWIPDRNLPGWQSFCKRLLCFWFSLCSLRLCGSGFLLFAFQTTMILSNILVSFRYLLTRSVIQLSTGFLIWSSV